MSDPLQSLLDLAGHEPPALVSQPNPARAAWASQLATLQAAMDGAQRARDQARGELASAQSALDAELAAEPEPTVTNSKGQEVTNLAHTDWAARVRTLTGSRDATSANVAARQRELDAATQARDSWAAQAPAAQVIVLNPDRAAWLDQIGRLRGLMLALRWDQVFDADIDALRAVLSVAQSALAAEQAMLADLQRQLAAQQASADHWSQQVPAIAAEVDAARSAVQQWQASVQSLQQQLAALDAQRPPETLTEPNPAYADWQARVNQLAQALSDARARAVDPQQAVDQAQAAVQAHLDEEPDPYIDNDHGAHKPNPAHVAWAREQARLQGVLDNAVAAARPFQQAITDAQAAYDAAVAASPPTTVQVVNPAFTSWQAQMNQLDQAITVSQVHLNSATVALNDAERRLDAARAALQQAQAQVAGLPDRINAASASLPALQAAVTQAAAALAPIEARRAVLLGQSALDDVVLDTFSALFQRWNGAEAALRDTEDAAQAADDNAWRLQSRVAELDRAIALTDTQTGALQAAQRRYQEALDKADTLQANPPDLP
jgi:chromosome segregation ATPase